MTNEENKKTENTPNLNPQLPEGLEDKNNLNLSTTKLKDGTEIISDTVEPEEVEEKPEITDEDLQKLVHFTTGIKDLTSEELDSLRNDDKELERLLRISVIKGGKLTYNPKKNFDTVFRKKRQRKNKMAKASRRANR